jgi:hypothetical protein
MSDDESKASEAPKAPWLTRIVLGIAGTGLLFGFFLPWIRIGQMVTLSGVALATTGGQAVSAMSGPYGLMIFAVPLSGAGLFYCAVRGHRAIAWIGLVGGFVIASVGFLTLVRVFLDSTGVGMWIVALSSLLAIIVGLAQLRGPRA